MNVMMKMSTHNPVVTSLRPYQTDLDLTRAAGEGDPVAQQALVERIFNRVHRSISYCANGSSDVDDLVQNALIKILHSAHTYRGDCTLEFWAMLVATRQVSSHVIKNTRRHALRQVAGVVDQPESIEPDSLVERKRFRKTLGALLATLLPERRTAVVLHHIEGYRIREIAEITGASVNTVRDRLREGRRQIKDLITNDPVLSQRVKTRMR